MVVDGESGLTPEDLFELIINVDARRRRKRALNPDDMKNHGCFCGRVFNPLYQVGHKISSTYDEICKNNHNCEDCLGALDSCSHTDGFPYTVHLVNGAYECKSSANTDCQQNKCQCDMNTFNRLIAHEKATGVFFEKVITFNFL